MSETIQQQFLRVQMLADERGPTLPLVAADKAALRTVLRVAMACSRELADFADVDWADVLESAAGEQ